MEIFFLIIIGGWTKNIGKPPPSYSWANHEPRETTLPETNGNFAPENGWKMKFPFGARPISGASC